MAFDFFSQPQGPAIPISLFGDASNAGINAGNAQRTPLQATIEGVLSGIQTGQNIAAKGQQLEIGQQQIAINENTIENLPTANKMDEERLKAAQMKNQSDALALKIETDNKETIELQKKAELETAALDSQNKLEAVKSRDEISNLLKSNDPAEKLKIIQDPRFGKTLYNDPKFAENVIGQLYPIMNETQKKNAMAALDFSKQHYYDEIKKDDTLSRLTESAKERQKDFRKAQGDISLAPVLREAGTDISNLEIVQATHLTPNPDGTPKTDANGNPVTVPIDKTWEVRQGGKLLKTRITDETAANNLQAYINSSKSYDTLLKEQIGLKDKVKTPTPEPSKEGNIPVFGESVQPARTTQQPQTGENLTVEDRLAQKREQMKAKFQQQKQTEQATSLQNNATPEMAAKAKEFKNEKPVASPSTFNARSADISQGTKGKFQNVAYHPALEGYSPLIIAQAKVESNFKEGAVSHNKKGEPVAVGLMQIRPSTFNDVTRRYNLKNYDINNPEQNVEVGALYMAEQIKKFGSEPGNGLELALAAYNTGPGRVADALRNAIANGRPSWEGVKIELKEMLNPDAYKEVSSYPGKILKQLSKNVYA